jgi:hypothetical protein
VVGAPPWPNSVPQEVQNFAFAGRRVPHRVQKPGAPAVSVVPVRVEPPHAVQNLFDAPCLMPQEVHVTKFCNVGAVVGGSVVCAIAEALITNVPQLVQNLLFPRWTRPQDGHVRWSWTWDGG